MSANSTFIVAAAVFTLGGFALVLTSIKYGFKWSKVAEIGLLRAFGFHILFALTGLMFVLVGVFAVYATEIRPSETALNIFGYVGQFLIPIFVVIAWYKVRFWRAVQALIPFFVSSLAVLAFAYLILRPCAYESFSIPTNGMAPTLLGEHVELSCPNCGSPAYGSPPDHRNHPDSDDVKMICSKELRTVFGKSNSSPVHSGDQITACKLIAPRRWDIIVFRVPSDPSICYASRLVGLPNEELVIRDGAVWINGEKQIPPDSIPPVHYSATVSLYGEERTGAGSLPVTLGSDEYFVLGDFSDNAFDSRFWSEGARDRPPYAIPKANIVGVVINVYWPPNRWTSFR